MGVQALLWPGLFLAALVATTWLTADRRRRRIERVMEEEARLADVPVEPWDRCPESISQRVVYDAMCLGHARDCDYSVRLRRSGDVWLLELGTLVVFVPDLTAAQAKIEDYVRSTMEQATEVPA